VLDACSDLLARWDGLSLGLCGGGEVDLGDWPFAAPEFVATVDARELPAGAWQTVTVALHAPP
jgi:hypothetical protein